jgi:hypothetical protein
LDLILARFLEAIIVKPNAEDKHADCCLLVKEFLDDRLRQVFQETLALKCIGLSVDVIDVVLVDVG